MNYVLYFVLAPKFIMRNVAKFNFMLRASVSIRRQNPKGCTSMRMLPTLRANCRGLLHLTMFTTTICFI